MKLYNDPNSNTEVLNPAAFAVFQAVARMAAENEDGHKVIDNTEGAYMPLHVEILQTEERQTVNRRWIHRLVSLAHYGELNGDLMKDPDMVFLWHEEPEAPERSWAVPVEYQNDYAAFYQQAVKYDPSLQLIGVRPKVCRDLVDFCDLWMKNIKEQHVTTD